jgi:hypothetical protein
MKGRHLLLLLSACVFSVSSLTATKYTYEWAASFTSNLAAGFLSSFLTVLLIDRALERERQGQTKRIRKLAFAQLRPAVLRHIILLFGLYKAAIPEPPHFQPTNFKQVFGEDYFREVRFLDFSKPSPSLPQTTWLSFTGAELDSFTVEIRQVIDKYAIFLEPETLELLGSMTSSNLVNAFVKLHQTNLLAMDQAKAIQRRYNLLDEASFNRALRAHIEKLESFLSSFNDTASESIDLADLHLWRVDVSPQFGTGRISEQGLRRPNIPIMMGKRADLPNF